MPLRCKETQWMMMMFMMLLLPHFRRKISHLPVPSEAKKVNKPEDRRRRLRRPNALFHSTHTQDERGEAMAMALATELLMP